MFVRLDVTREADWQQAVATAEGRFGALHILVIMLASAAMARSKTPPSRNGIGSWISTRQASSWGARRSSPLCAGPVGGLSLTSRRSLASLGGQQQSAIPGIQGAVRLLTKATAIQYAAAGIRPTPYIQVRLRHP